jgi:hypothetical protein
MAQLLALAGRRGGGRDLPARRQLLFLALVLPGGVPFAGIAPLAALLLARRRGDGLVHGHDLRLAAHGAGMASRPGAGDLPGSRLGTGALLLAMIGRGFRRSVGILLRSPQYRLALVAVSETGLLARIDGAPAPYTIAQAIGIPGRGAIRPLDPPHTQPNFVMREMGYAVARRHAMRLRRWVMGLLLPRSRSSPWHRDAVAGTGARAPASLAVSVRWGMGVWVERWLFFAEARHVSMLYYGETLGGAEAVAR